MGLFRVVGAVDAGDGRCTITAEMSIVIENPELERLLRERLDAGGFADMDELLLDALQHRRDEPEAGTGEEQSLVEFFRDSPLVGVELELERDSRVACL